MSATLTPFMGATKRDHSERQSGNVVHATTFELLTLRDRLDYPVRTLCGRELYPNAIWGHVAWPQMVTEARRLPGIKTGACRRCVERTEVDA